MTYVEGYGYCPTCGTTRGISRERSPYGCTTCACGSRTRSKTWRPLVETNTTRCHCEQGRFIGRRCPDCQGSGYLHTKAP